MRQDYLPYYLSRAVLSAIIAILVVGFTWRAALVFAVIFGFFLLYLHSGWYRVDLNTPFTPLRRDTMGREIQRKSIILAVIAGVVSFLISPYLNSWLSLSIPLSIGLPVGVLGYFCVQFFLFLRK